MLIGPSVPFLVFNIYHKISDRLLVIFARLTSYKIRRGYYYSCSGERRASTSYLVWTEWENTLSIVCRTQAQVNMYQCIYHQDIRSTVSYTERDIRRESGLPCSTLLNKTKSGNTLQHTILHTLQPVCILSLVWVIVGWRGPRSSAGRGGRAFLPSIQIIYRHATTICCQIVTSRGGGPASGAAWCRVRGTVSGGVSSSVWG